MIALLTLVALPGCSQRNPSPAVAATSSAPSAGVVGQVDQPSDARPRDAEAPPVEGTVKLVTEIDALDDTTFWAVADGRVFETRDAGATFVDRTPFSSGARAAGGLVGGGFAALGVRTAR